MKETNCIIIGLITITGALTFVGCSTNSDATGSANGISSFSGQSSEDSSALSSTPGACGGFDGTGGTAGCVGSFTGFANITNSETGTIWFTPPAGTTNCVVTDSSGLSDPYVSVVKAVRKDWTSWCGTNSVSFPASSTKQYKFVIYTKNTPPPPTNGHVLTLDVQWQP